MKRFILGMVLATACCLNLAARGKADASKANKQVLVIGLNDNIRSNHFPTTMLSEETGLVVDSIDVAYNRAIAMNIVTSVKEGAALTFKAHEGIDRWESLLTNVTLEGENEESYANLSNIAQAELEQLMEEADADYLLILNQHYLKWQEEPLRTLFHFVSYSLYNKEKEEITRGHNYFTCMKPENEMQLRKSSRKSSSKIALAITKNVTTK